MVGAVNDDFVDDFVVPEVVEAVLYDFGGIAGL